MRYEIKNNELFGYVESQEEPVLYQPQKPDGTAWADEAEMVVWAEAWIAHMTDPENNEFPA